MARLAVHRMLALPIKDIAFETTDKGKPFLHGVPRFHFNLSHSGTWILCAAAKAPIGVDVERLHPLSPELLIEVLTAEEREVYDSHHEDARLSYFYTLWTIKESYAKAQGLGLQLQFRDLTVRLKGHDGIHVLYGGEVDRTVRVETHLLDSDHPAATCVFLVDSLDNPYQVFRWDMESFLREWEKHAAYV